ncbi:tyrosine phosphatase family-domain-containing protein [Geopyxis carbonaria]|nr:tyrosine phosphatase family-domain-containing protein [Geopyxis carbonaria]
MSYSTETFIQPDNFARVAGAVYRSSFPKPENFSYMKKLGLKTILTLVPEAYPEENNKFMNENGIIHIQVGMPGNKEQDSLSDPRVPDEKITAALKIILDKRNHPILIHCNKGKHRTGTVVGCLRKFQSWSPPLAIEEYRRYAGIKNRARDERKIENYGLESCWELAVENGWTPTSFVVDEQKEEEVDSILAVAGPAAIKAQ